MAYSVKIVKIGESGGYSDILYEQIVPELDITAVIATVNKISYYVKSEETKEKEA